VRAAARPLGLSTGVSSAGCGRSNVRPWLLGGAEGAALVDSGRRDVALALELCELCELVLLGGSERKAVGALSVQQEVTHYLQGWNVAARKTVDRAIPVRRSTIE
jgi:hypothetical protein